MSSLPEDIRLRFEDRADYLFAEVSGPRDSRAISIAYWTLIATACHQRDTTRLMVVENLGDHEQLPELRELIESLVSMGFEGVRIAFVAGRVEQMARMEQAEIFAQEMGADVRVFASVPIAEHWLRHGGD